MVAIFQMTFFKCIFLNENAWISINSSLNFVPMGQINNISGMILSTYPIAVLGSDCKCKYSFDILWKKFSPARVKD